MNQLTHNVIMAKSNVQLQQNDKKKHSRLPLTTVKSQRSHRIYLFVMLLLLIFCYLLCSPLTLFFDSLISQNNTVALSAKENSRDVELLAVFGSLCSSELSWSPPFWTSMSF